MLYKLSFWLAVGSYAFAGLELALVGTRRGAIECMPASTETRVKSSLAFPFFPVLDSGSGFLLHSKCAEELMELKGPRPLI